MRRAIIAAAVIAATVDVLYVEVVIPSQHAEDPAYLTVPFVAAFIALMAICALGSMTSAIRWRPLLLGAASTGLLLIGFFALMSIGLPLFAAGVVLLITLIATLSSDTRGGGRRPFSRIGMAVGGGALSIALLLGGFSLTEVMIKCPASGQMGGGGSTLLGANYSYRCDNGNLTLTR